MTSPQSSTSRFSADIRLSGLGLRLREWANADLPVMVDLFDEMEVDRWTPLRHPFDLTAASTYLAAARARRAEGRSIQLAITTDGHTALGEILLFPTGPVDEDHAGTPNWPTPSAPSTAAKSPTSVHHLRLRLPAPPIVGKSEHASQDSANVLTCR